MSDEQKGLSALPSKTAFYLGLIGGVLAICTLGFLFLLGGLLRGGSFSLGNLNPRIAAVDPGAREPAPTPDSGTTQPSSPPPAVSATDHIRGDVNAKVTLIEYSDFECPFCKQFHATMQQAMDNYKGKIRWVFRHYPLSFHQNAQKEAEASECVAELGGNDAFWKFTDAIFTRTTSNGTGFAIDALPDLAKEIGVDSVKFKTCLDSGKYAQFVKDQETAGATAGVNGTPGTFVVSADGKSQLVPGALPYASIKQIIDGVL